MKKINSKKMFRSFYFHPKTKRDLSLTGFTLIELLVVIAIIGILSSVVLGSLNTARAKGSDAAIKSNLDGVRSQAEIYFDDHQYKYGVQTAGKCPDTAPANVFGDANIFNAITQANTAGGGGVTSNTLDFAYCSSSNNAWALAVKLRTSDDDETAADPPGSNPDAWCVDSSGTAKLYSYVAGNTIANTITSNKCN
ncbi:MAG: type II secretion system protein [Candidatus Paceibacterota bacterium]